MNIYSYIAKRLLYTIPILLGVCLLIFLIFNVVAGDPTPMLLGKHATAKQMAALRHELGLDKSWFIQYVDILKSAFTLDFGRSWFSKQHIASMLQTGTVISLTLVVPTLFISHFIAIVLGLLAAYKRGNFVDKAMVVVTVMLMSISALTYILFGQWLFAYKLGWFQVAGYTPSFPEVLSYITLPCLILIILNIGADMRFYRTVILDEIYQDYVRTARANGIPEWVILGKHVLKNAMIPIVTNFMFQIPALLFGTILVESFFGIPGLGGILLQAINNSDFPIIKAMTILSAMFYIVINLITDILYTWLDPRIKLS